MDYLTGDLTTDSARARVSVQADTDFICQNVHLYKNRDMRQERAPNVIERLRIGYRSDISNLHTVRRR
jgi:hypothetical protein